MLEFEGRGLQNGRYYEYQVRDKEGTVLFTFKRSYPTDRPRGNPPEGMVWVPSGIYHVPANIYWKDPAYDDYPVVDIDWFDAYAYARWKGKRLPTEAEWQAAAGGPLGDPWPWGSLWAVEKEPQKCSWKGGGSEKRSPEPGPAKVKSFPEDRSRFGAYDLAGNVAEWVEFEPALSEEIYSSAQPTNVNNPHAGIFPCPSYGGCYRDAAEKVRCDRPRLTSQGKHQACLADCWYLAGRDLGFRCVQEASVGSPPHPALP